MSRAPIGVRRSSLRLLPDPRRVIAKPFVDDVAVPSEESRCAALIRRVLAMPLDEAASVLDRVVEQFAHRHHDFERLLERHFEMVAGRLRPGDDPTPVQRLLIGAYVTNEYSIESAALFNPSLVRAPAQDGLAPGEARVVMSLRAVGEGHISSIELRSGVVDGAGDLRLDPPGDKLVTGTRSSPDVYALTSFSGKLAELGVWNDLARAVLARLPARFTSSELDDSLGHFESGPPDAIRYETLKIMRVLAASSYVTRFPPASALGERVIFPAGPHETRGMEDARFVRFVDTDGDVTYYATYTAYDGFEILPQLIETRDFLSFKISTLHGAAAQNKGMALFPRRVAGRFVMLSRKDRENLYLATSDDVHAWEEVTEIHEGSRSWELRHIGNCGSPIETSEGWVVITHGVGPMRRYVLGALLLDLDDPARVIGSLRDPLLEPDETEREGYVPNVLYSCGGLQHGDCLVLPYGFADRGVGVATIAMPDLLAALRGRPA